MLAGVEARVPLLDTHVARLAMSLPVEWNLKGLKRKVILRDAVKERLPAEIFDAPKKGFGVPYHLWLARNLNTYAREAILDDAFIKRFNFNKEKLEYALSIQRHSPRYRSFTLWKIFQLALWAEEFPA
jgi:asparagine synthase (glutamine-hydrolysing)